VEQDSFLGRSPILLRALLFFMFTLGLGIRLYDLTDQPLDFHPTRQLRSAIIARDMYFEHLPSAPQWKQQLAAEQLGSYNLIEPPILEGLVAWTYGLIGSDPVWVARIYASLFWLIGGVALFKLVQDMTSADGGVIALAYYLFLPFGIIASRSFQPDPLMVMMIILALWAIYRWHRLGSWKSAWLAGGLAGLALFVKAVALFPVLAGFLALVLLSKGLRRAASNPQVWVVGALAILPMITYHFYGVFILGSLESQFEGRFFPEMWLDPAFYVRWVQTASNLIGFGAIMGGIFGLFLFSRPDQRAFGVGLWGGYLLYGMTFPYHINTHSYYQLPLIPIVAITIAPLAWRGLRELVNLKPAWLVRVGFLGLLLFGISVKVWDVRVELVRNNYRNEPAYWQEIADTLGRNSSVVALTHDYGNRLAYYGWITPQVWLPSGHLEKYRELRGGAPIDVQNWFKEITGNKDYFLVTLMNQLNKQPELKELLYDNYAVYDQGDGYIIFDLHHPIK